MTANLPNFTGRFTDAGSARGDAESFTRACRAARARSLAMQPLSMDGIAIRGVGIECIEDAPRIFRALLTNPIEPDLLSVVASHFPVLTESRRLASRGLPYPGDLANRAELLGWIEGNSAPVVVLRRHVHARVARHRGSMLQFGFGALIEPPFDCAVVKVQPGPEPRVERRCQRLGPVARIEPVFSPHVESWSYAGGSWAECS